MHTRALRSIGLQAALLIGATLGGVSGATADPGPKCTLKTPAARGRVRNDQDGDRGADHQPRPDVRRPEHRLPADVSAGRLALPLRSEPGPAHGPDRGGDGLAGRAHHHAEAQEGRQVFGRHAGPGRGRRVMPSSDGRAAGLSSAFIAPITGAKAAGDDTIVWTLSSPYPDFKHAIASHFLGIHPKKQIVEKTPAEYFKKPVSAGPLMLAEWTPGTDLMVLKANPNYWAKPHVQELRIMVIPDATSRLLALQQGSVDYVYTLPLNAASQVDASKVTDVQSRRARNIHAGREQLCRASRTRR